MIANYEEVNTAVILAGGAGSRLWPLTKDCPKPMVRLLGKPILHWIVEWLAAAGIRRIVLGVAYKKEAIKDYFGNGEQFGVDVKYSNHSVSGETAEGFRLAIERHVDSEVFLAMNGDELTNLNLRKFIGFHLKHKPLATIALSHPKCPFGIVELGQNNKVVGFNEKPELQSVLVSTGIYVFNRKIVEYLPEKGRIEQTAFPLLASKGLIRGYEMNCHWITVNTVTELMNAEHELKKWRKEEVCLTY